MGKNDRARRAEKRRRQAHARRPTATPPTAPTLLAKIWEAVEARNRRNPRLSALVALITEPRGEVVAAIESQLVLVLAKQWLRGWMPTDMARAVTRLLSAAHGGGLGPSLVAAGRQALAVDGPVDPRWPASLDAAMSFIAESAPGADELSVEQWIELLALVGSLVELPEVCPPPGRPDSRAGRPNPHASAADVRQLERVRALLAKAESTTFPEEAEALTTKAQELIARYSIDRALVDAEEPSSAPVSTRIWLDDPYADAKGSLLSGVAAANRCQCVTLTSLGAVMVFGFASDLDATELLFSSLLVQATTAMTSHGSVRDARGRSRTRSFRRAFLHGFGERIGRRLREATASEVTAHESAGGPSALPVLARRDHMVEAARDEAFPRTTQARRPSVSNHQGYVAGTVAAELAHLGPHASVLAAGR